MPTRKRHTKTPEQRAAEAQALHDTLTAQVEQLVTSEEWMRFLAFTRSFHAYSLNNLLLILAQCPHASRVAGFRQWQAKGRQVRKGERGTRCLRQMRALTHRGAGPATMPGVDIRIDLDAAAAQIVERRDAWEAKGITVGDLTWCEVGEGWPPALKTVRSEVRDADSLGVALTKGAQEGSVVLFLGGWADLLYWSGIRQTRPWTRRQGGKTG